MQDCIFCKISQGTIPGDIVYQDEQLLVLRDISPQAPVHLLVFPRDHYADIVEASHNPRLLSALLAKCASLGREMGEQGFRIVVNTGEHGGQTVGHLHFHVLAGRQMQWPPG